MAETSPRRPRNILLDEFPSATKEEASQALRDSMGDMGAARRILLAAAATGEDTDDEIPQDADDDDSVQLVVPPPPDEDDDEEEPPEDPDYDSEAFEAEMRRIQGEQRKRTRGAGKGREKLSDEEKARRKAARKAKAEAARAERARQKAADAAAMKANREKLLSGGGAADQLAPYAGKSSFRSAVGARPNFTDAKLLYVRTRKKSESQYGDKYDLVHTFVVDGADVVQWWTGSKTEERKLFREGCVASFAGTVKKHATFEGVDITTVRAVKAHVIDGARVAPTPKPRGPPKDAPFSGKGRRAADSDDSEAEAQAPKASPAKKPRVKGGAQRQKALHRELLREDDEADPMEYDTERDARAARGNASLKELARLRAERAMAKKG
mmetsp:Transcript_26962/g.80845  ORF Transcript_26962/g.80845 Transcript_26962/m.80845 type:complete len:382 (+) Transcript_26962:201-1346(+)